MYWTVKTGKTRENNGLIHLGNLLTQIGKQTTIQIRAFQKKFKLFLQPGRLTYMILALKESMKFFLAKSTAPVFSSEPIDTSPSQAGSGGKIEAVDLA